MTKGIFGLVLFLIGSNVFAGSLNFDGRFDSDSSSSVYSSEKPNDTTQPTAGYTKFYMQTGRLDYKGKLAEDLTFRVRLRFNKTMDNVAVPTSTSTLTVNQRDSLNKLVDFASITHKMEAFSLTVGKVDVGFNGFEGATSGADLYFTSQAYNAVPDRYLSGFTGTHSMGDHSLTLGFYNNVNDSYKAYDSAKGTAQFNQSSLLSGLMYKGAFMDKVLSVVVSYHTVNPVLKTSTLSATSASNSATKDGVNTYTTLGLKYDQKIWDVSLDLNSYSTESGVLNTKSDKLTSTVLSAGYKVEDNMTVKAKYEMSLSSPYRGAWADGTDKSIATVNTTGTGLTLEYKPIKDADFRYHLAYTNVAMKTAGTTLQDGTVDTTGYGNSKTDTHVIAGVRFNADFLK